MVSLKENATGKTLSEGRASSLFTGFIFRKTARCRPTQAKASKLSLMLHKSNESGNFHQYHYMEVLFISRSRNCFIHLYQPPFRRCSPACCQPFLLHSNNHRAKPYRDRRDVCRSMTGQPQNRRVANFNRLSKLSVILRIMVFRQIFFLYILEVPTKKKKK